MEPSSTTAKEQRLPALHRLIDELPPAELEIVEQVLARLEMERLWKKVREGFDTDWAAGKYDKIDEVIREVRESLKTHAA
jgi:hypothetical protein